MGKWVTLAPTAAVAVAAFTAVACGQTADDPTSTPAGDDRPGPATATPTTETCREYLSLLVSVDEGSTEKPAVATSYRCMSLHVDSTAQYPSKAPSLALTRGMPLSLRLGAERKPLALELRLYSGSGIYGSFFKWPEELFFADQGPVDTLQPTPSLAFHYLPRSLRGNTPWW